MNRRYSALLLAALLAPGSVPLAGQNPPVVNGAIASLKPGQFLWAPDVAPMGPVTIIISLKTQRAYAYRNGLPIGVSTVSTGKPGHLTPTGVFTILQKQVIHKSNKYSNGPMPFMERLTWDGVAMHAGGLPGHPSSHGCIHLPRGFAILLYGITKLGMTVVITDDALVPQVAPSPDVLEASATDTADTNAIYSWHPERSRSGPLSIVISGHDKQMVVIRNGIEIGTGKLVIAGDVTTTMAFNLTAINATGNHWLRLPLPGQASNEARELTPAERGRVRIPDPFRKLVAAALQPGTTLLVTRDTLASAGTGKRLRVVEAEAK